MHLLIEGLSSNQAPVSERCYAAASHDDRLRVQRQVDKAGQIQVDLTYRAAPVYYWNTVPVRTMLLTFTSLSKRSREKYESCERCC